MNVMNLSRRLFLHLAVTSAALPGSGQVATAQSFPIRPVHLIVPSASGSTPDTIARLLSYWLSERLAQEFIVENRPGAGQYLAAEALVRAPSDGHTLLLATTAHAIGASLYHRLNFNFMRDTAAVAGCARVPNIMVVNPSVPARTVAEFITYAKANPGRINMASAGNGTTPHLAGELFKSMAGVNLLHVPYRGGTPALTDLIGGRVHVMFELLPASIEHIKMGRLRALGVATSTRVAALPDVPAVSEFLAGYEISSWSGFVAPAKTPADIIIMLNMTINAGLADPSITARLASLGSEPMVMSPSEFGKFIADETAKWAGVIATANIRSD